MGSQRKQVFSRVSFLEGFWPKTARHFWGISSSSRFWRRARVHAQHGWHCDPRSTVQLRPRTSVLRLILTYAHQLTSCPHYPKAGPGPLHVLGRLIATATTVGRETDNISNHKQQFLHWCWPTHRFYTPHAVRAQRIKPHAILLGHQVLCQLRA